MKPKYKTAKSMSPADERAVWPHIKKPEPYGAGFSNQTVSWQTLTPLNKEVACE